jgi:hypothetical protein
MLLGVSLEVVPVEKRQCARTDRNPQGKLEYRNQPEQPAYATISPRVCQDRARLITEYKRATPGVCSPQRRCSRDSTISDVNV